MKDLCSSMKNDRSEIELGIERESGLGKDKRLSSVAMAMALLKCFADEKPELSIASLASQLGVAKSTAHRLATTLTHAGMLEQNKDNSKYRLGLTVFELGSLVRRKMDVYNEAKIFLRELREKTQETVNLAILRDYDVVYLNSLESPKAIKVISILGMRLASHCSAEGKVLLAFGPPEAEGRVLQRGLLQRTPQTIVDPASFRAELAAIRLKGYAIDAEEGEVGVRAIAAPVFGADEHAIAAVGIAGPAQRLNKRTLISFVPALLSIAAAISHRHGARPPAAGPLRIVKS